MVVWGGAIVVSFVATPLIIKFVYLNVCTLFRLFIHHGRHLLVVRGVDREVSVTSLKGELDLPSCNLPHFSFDSLGAKYLLVKVNLKVLMNFFYGLVITTGDRSLSFHGRCRTVDSTCNTSILLFKNLKLVITFIVRAGVGGGRSG